MSENTKDAIRAAIEHLRAGEADKALAVLECALPGDADPDQLTMWDMLFGANDNKEAALGAVA